MLGAPGGNRTPDPQLRRLLLYPTELLALGLGGAARCCEYREFYKPHQVGAPGFEPGTSCSQSRRDTRLRYAPQNEPRNVLSTSTSVNRARPSRSQAPETRDRGDSLAP